MVDTVDGKADVRAELSPDGGVRLMVEFPDQPAAVEVMHFTPSEADALVKQMIGILQKTSARWGAAWFWHLPNGKVQAARIRPDGILEHSSDYETAEAAEAALG